MQLPVFFVAEGEKTAADGVRGTKTKRAQAVALLRYTSKCIKMQKYAIQSVTKNVLQFELQHEKRDALPRKRRKRNITVTHRRCL